MDIQQKFLDEVPKLPGGSIVFLSGGAGVGKTFTINKLLPKLGNVVKCAFTGASALLIGGKTAHSLFGIPTDGFLDPGIPSNKIQNRRFTDKSTRYFQKKKTEVLAATNWIVWEEVSQTRCDMPDFVDKVMRNAKKEPHKPFGGANVILVGDRGQIPPVINDDRQLRRWGYVAPFDALEARVVKEARVRHYHLNKVYRQENPIDANILNRIRIGTQTKSDLSRINHCICEKPPFGSTVLCSLNRHVDKINASQLDKINGKDFFFHPKRTGSLKKLTNTPIRLRIGCRVMVLDNGKCKSQFAGNIEYVNGDTGIFEGVDKHKRMIIQRDRDKEVLLIKPKKAEDIDYTVVEKEDEDGQIVKELHEKVKGKYIQYPVRLAYAMSGHKSQGKTLDKVHIMLGNYTNRVLETPGFMYTILSRVRSLDNLSLDRKVTDCDIVTSSAVKDGVEEQQWELGI